MQKLFCILVVSLGSLTSFAQGKIGFLNDSLHLCYYPFGFPSGLGGQAVDSAHMPFGVTLGADLYVGTSSSLLSLISSTTFSLNAGHWNNVNVIVPGIPGGTTVFVRVQIRDLAFAPSLTWTIQDGWGYSEMFPFALGSGITYPRLPSQGTWPVGTFNLDQYIPGARGAIAVGIPEPSTLALAGLASLTVLRRWKIKD